MNLGVKQCKIDKEYKIPKSLLSGIWKSRVKVYDSVASGCVNPKSSRLRTAKHGHLEAELILQFKTIRDKNSALTSTIVKIKAEEIANRLNISDFKFSDNWFARFKTRNGTTSPKKLWRSKKSFRI